MKPYLEETHHNERAGGVAQGVSPKKEKEKKKEKVKGLGSWLKW
jgi:hypothetical protein